VLNAVSVALIVPFEIFGQPTLNQSNTSFDVKGCPG